MSVERRLGRGGELAGSVFNCSNLRESACVSERVILLDIAAAVVDDEAEGVWCALYLYLDRLCSGWLGRDSE